MEPGMNDSWSCDGYPNRSLGGILFVRYVEYEHGSVRFVSCGKLLVDV